MQIHRKPHYFTAEAAFQAAYDWYATQGDEGCRFIIDLTLQETAGCGWSGGWSVRVEDDCGEVRGYVRPSD